MLVRRRAAPLDDVARQIEAKGGSALAADVNSERDVRDVFAPTVQQYGRVDVRVNNAGIAGPIARIGQIPFDRWLESNATNVTGPWLCCRAAGPAMVPAGEGAIVNIGSISGKRPLAQGTPYCASKMALLGLTRALALELGPANVRVNCISPGAVLMARLELLAQPAKTPLPELLNGAASISALRRVTEVRDVAALCVYLASPAARNVTGQDFTVDAGTYMD